MLLLIRQNKIYFSILGFYFCLVSLLLLTNEKGTFVLFLNKNHNPFLDSFFYYITFLGDGWFIVPFLLFYIGFKNCFEGMVLTTSIVLTFLSIQFLKNIPFQGTPRPSKYFPSETSLHFVSGIEIHGYNSFPSGHAGQAFALFLLLSVFAKNKLWAIPFIFLAILTALSRVYLAQHFLVDTYVGAILATIISFATIVYYTNYTSLSTNSKLQKGILF